MKFHFSIKKEIILTYGECQRNISATLHVLRKRFSDQNFSKFKVKRVVNLFEDTGSVRETKRICTKSVTENKETVAAVIN
jgi:hypothetical protein